MRFLLIVFLMVFAFPVHAALTIDAKGHLWVENSQNAIEVFGINEMIDHHRLSNYEIYHEGSVNLVELKFTDVQKPNQLVSVRRDGIYFHIAPFENYHVLSVDNQGWVQFHEEPNAKYIIKCGFFIDSEQVVEWKEALTSRMPQCGKEFE